MEPEKNNNYVNYSTPGGEPAPGVTLPSEPEAPRTWRDAVGPLLALGLSILFWQVFALDNLAYGFGPGLGVPVFVLAYFAALAVVLGPRPTPGGAALTAASLALAVSCALYAHIGFTIFNCFGILLLAAMATFSFSGQSRFRVLDLRAIPEAVQLSVLALFTRIDRPFRCAARLGRHRRGALVRWLGTALVTLVLLAAVLALLASADMVFGSFFAGIRQRWEELSPGLLVWQIIRAVILALFIASGFVFVREPAPAATAREPRGGERQAAPYLVPVLALDLVYVVFCAIQLRYLFGGAETAAMAGGWAEYARAGFFQLAAVAVINLALCLAGAGPERFAARGGAVLRAADGVLLLLTTVILASAWYRMHLYISAYGLSILRLLTLWAMLVILAGLLTAGWKLIRPAFPFWKVFFSFAVAAWCILCLAGPAGQVADYNVDAYLSGRLETVDMDYLSELGADAVPALDRLAEGSEKYAAQAGRVRRDLEETVQTAEGRWALWKRSFRELS